MKTFSSPSKMLLFLLPLIKTNISNELEIAIENQKMGKIKAAHDFYDSYYHKYANSALFISKHIEFLFWIGDYDSINRKYGHLKYDVIKKAKECINILNSKDNYKISRLIDISPYCPTVIEACIKEDLKNNLSKSFYLIQRGKTNWPDNQVFDKYDAQYYFLQGFYDIGINKLEDIGFYTLARDIKKKYTNFNLLDKSRESTDLYIKLEKLYTEINEKLLSDDFQPSFYSKLLENVLYKLVKMSVIRKLPGMAILGHKLFDIRNDEESRYLFVLTLIFDNRIQLASDEIKEKPFKDTKLSNEILNYLEDAEKEKEGDFCRN